MGHTMLHMFQIVLLKIAPLHYTRLGALHVSPQTRFQTELTEDRLIFYFFLRRLCVHLQDLGAMYR